MHSLARPDLCPACDRFIGPRDVCPYCGTDSARNPLLRPLRLGSLLIAAAGLLLLYLTAVGRDPPAVEIGSITPAMNFACVRVRGTVTRDAYVASETGGRTDYVSFPMDDGTGELRVTAYGGAAARLADGARLPSRGACVEAVGNLDVRGNRVRLRLESEEHLRAEEGP